MSRLKIAIENEALSTVERLYKDLERRIVASPPGLCPVDLALNFLRLCHAQSCGKCVPCRIGLGQLETYLTDVLEGRGTMETLESALLPGAEIIVQSFVVVSFGGKFHALFD